MADVSLYDSPVSYPKISAQNNAKFELTLRDRFEVTVPVKKLYLVARRGATTDPWEIETYIREDRFRMAFRSPELNLDSSDFAWKSMADLALKMRLRSARGATWSLYEINAPPIAKSDAGELPGAKEATLAEMQAETELKLDQCGNFTAYWKGTGSLALQSARSILTQLATMLAAVLADTTHTSLSGQTTAYIDGYAFDDEDEKYGLTTRMTLKSVNGTDDVSVGNYTATKLRLHLVAASAGGYDSMDSKVDIASSKAYAIPSLQLDHLRRAASAGLDPYLDFTAMKGAGITCTVDLYPIATASGLPILAASVLSPDSIIQIDLDQANSMNVLAAAAFAGLAGLAPIGAATELTNLLANSDLASVFQEAAIFLGTNTTAVISGYVSALIAAYTNGWISNDDLFSIQSHMDWLKSGTNILVAAGVASGVGSLGIGALLTYLGVTDASTLAIAATGAAAGAGVALGMASVMAKVKKYRYLGE